MRRFGRLLIAAFAFALASAGAAAQAPYPAKPVKIIVPYAPGGLTDVVARLFAEQLRKAFGQGVVVENKPGASGIVAIEEMARARPDGYTLMIGNISTNGLTPVLLAKKMKIDYDQGRADRGAAGRRAGVLPGHHERLPAQDLRRIHRLRQGASRQGPLRQRRRRQLPADQHRDAGQARRHRAPAYSVQGRRRADHPRPRQRRHPGVVVQHHQSGRHDEGRPRASAGDRGSRSGCRNIRTCRPWRRSGFPA